MKKIILVILVLQFTISGFTMTKDIQFSGNTPEKVILESDTLIQNQSDSLEISISKTSGKNEENLYDYKQIILFGLLVLVGILSVRKFGKNQDA